jgi:hypothetical protein
MKYRNNGHKTEWRYKNQKIKCCSGMDRDRMGENNQNN